MRLISALLAVILLVLALTAAEIYLASLANGGKIEPSDVAIVLGASIYGDEPSPVFRERINHAVNLQKNGIVKFIVFTGGFGTGEELSEAAVARNYTVRQGVPDNRILIEEQSRTTFQNLYFAGEIVRARQLNSVVLISDPLHIKRAAEMARDLKFENADISPTPTSRFISAGSKFEFLYEETKQLFFYRVRKLFSQDLTAGELAVKRN